MSATLAAWRWLAGPLLAVAVVAAYSNHFGNGFHFDDTHAVVDNPAIRTLAGIPHFFTDSRTFSSYPTAQSYRPLITASLAIDYALGGGLKPFWFHLSTFLWFLVLLSLMYALYMLVLTEASPHPWNTHVAWIAVALYGLHPASAETINYIVQRGDVYVALGIVGGVVLYASKPDARRFGLYLLPPLAAMFAKPTALIFAPILLAYIVLIDRRNRESVVHCVFRSIPAFVLCVAFSMVEKIMTPPTLFATSLRSFDYWITQPYVTLRYFRCFFVPLYLNVDTDLRAFDSLGRQLALLGIAFCLALVAAAIFTARIREWRPVSFGLWWFLLSLIPTAIYPLNEVENDHRMFLPFIGLSLAGVWTGAILLRIPRRSTSVIGAVAAAVIIGLFAWGTHVRNEVWHTDETLWRDDIEKSPNNPRGHYNLGVALAADSTRAPEAVQQFKAALRIKPEYTEAHINLGVVLADMPGRLPEAVAEYEAALRINPDSAEAHHNLGNALAKIPDRLNDAMLEYEAEVRINPGSAEAHNGLGVALTKIPGRFPDAIQQYEAALRIKPDFAAARSNLAVLLAESPARVPEAIIQYQAALRIQPESAEAHSNLGAALARIPGRLPEAIKEYESAVHLKPGFAEAHYNLGSALVKIPDHLQEAIGEYRAALRIRPDYAEAHTNLGVALTQIPGRLPEAVSEFQAAVRLAPDSAKAHSNLAVVLAQTPGRMPDAISEFEASYQLSHDPLIQRQLDQLRAKRP